MVCVCVYVCTHECFLVQISAETCEPPGMDGLEPSSESLLEWYVLYPLSHLSHPQCLVLRGSISDCCAELHIILLRYPGP